MTIEIKTRVREEFVDITGDVQRLARAAGVEKGLALVYSPHTTAGITINESFDPDVQRDMIAHLNKMVPPGSSVHHAEGNSDAHIKTSLVGSSCTVPIIGGGLALGRWQGIYFCEFDGPRSRQVLVHIV